jgi:hypothetical protein
MIKRLASLTAVMMVATWVLAGTAQAGPVGDLFYKLFGCDGVVAPISCPGPDPW